MLEEKENSLLFSLKELTHLEDERLRREAEDARRRVEEELAARRRDEEKARREEQARRDTEVERAARERQREREDAARLDAIRAAAIEKAKWEHEERVRISNEAARREDEERRRPRNNDKRARRLWFVVAALLLVPPAESLVFLSKARAARAACEERLSTSAEDGQRREAACKQERDELMDRVRERERQDVGVGAQPERTENRDALPPRHEPHRNKGRTFASPSKPDVCNCDPRDPLCGCLR